MTSLNLGTLPAACLRCIGGVVMVSILEGDKIATVKIVTLK
jgi:hypothetical protein